MSRLLRFILALFVLGALVVGVAALMTDDSTQPTETSTDGLARQMSAETADVTRRTLEENLKLNGTVSHGESKPLPIEADGIVTSAPAQDDIARPGDEIVRVNNRPITLAQGEVPLYRELKRVGKWDVDEAGDRIGLQEGPDVEQLQRFLVDNGFDDDERLQVDGIFGVTTERAVKAWQKAVGHPATGVVGRTQLLFIEGAVRVDSAPEVGDRFDEITVGALQPFINLQITNRQRSYFSVGTQVTIETDAGLTTGEVTKLERTIGGDGSTQHNARIEFTGDDVPAGASTVEVTSVRIIADDVLTVPVRALVALAEGGWAVQVQTSTDVTLTAVELGEVVDGLAEITGVDEGTRVVIPS